MARNAQGSRIVRLAGGAVLLWVVTVGCGKTGGTAKKQDAGSGAGGSSSDAATTSPGVGTGGSVAADAGVDRSASGGTVTSTGGGAGGGGGASTTSASGGATSSSGGAGRTGTGGLPGPGGLPSTGGVSGTGGAGGATGAPPEARDGGVDPTDAPSSVNGIQDYCAAWTKTVCAVEVACCKARGYKVSVNWCPVPSPLAYFPQQPVCSGKLVPSDNFNNASAQACIDAQAQLFAGCAPARRDSAAQAAAIASCEQIAPKPLPTSGQCNPELGCAAPVGKVSVCYYAPGSGGIAECSPPSTPLLEGERCNNEAVACAAGLVCGPAITCIPPLADGQACQQGVQCRSGYCDGVCASPPPIADSRCKELEQLASHALYMNTGGGTHVTVTKSRLVWLGYSGAKGEFLHHAPKDGSGPVMHLTPQAVRTYPTVELIADDDDVYDFDKGVVGRVALADGARQSLADVGFAGQMDVRDGNDLIVVGDYCNRMARVSVVDGSVTHHPGKHEGMADSQTPHAAVDDQAVYCTNGARITRFGRNGSFAVLTEQAVPSLGWTVELRAFGGRLYFWAGGDSVKDKELMRILDLGTGTISLVTPPSALGSEVATDLGKGLLFWGTATDVQQYAPASGAAVVVATPVPIAQQLALDESFFYWFNGDGLYRSPRP